MPVTATRRFVLGTAIAGAAWANAASLLRSPEADPYDGGKVIKGAGVVTTVLDPTSTTFGARGDGIVLGDLVTRAGSTTVTSATAPFTSTEVDGGKLVIWRGVGDSTGVGTIASVRSSTEAVLQQPASSSSQRDGGPNTNAAFGTDNTAALDKAFAAAQAAAALVSPDRRLRVPVVEVHLPRGVFLMRSLQPFEQAGVTVRGEGRFSTLLASVASGPWIQFSTFQADPSDAYQGTATDWTFRDIQFLNPAFGNTSSEGRRTGRALQDNGSGGVRIISCGFVGLSYGFCGAYGSDFSEIRESTFDNCDVGYYFGPGSQQIELTRVNASSCREGAVFEGAPQWHLGGSSSFEDPSVAAITIEARSSGRTRSGVPVTLKGAFYSGKFLIDQATWFETNSGNNGRTCPRMIWVRGDGPFGVPVEGVVVRDAFVIGGGRQVRGGHNAFLELQSDRVSVEPVVIEDLVMGGTYFNSLFRNSGRATTSNPRIIRPALPAGVGLTQGRAAGAKVLLRDGSMRGALRLTGPASGGTPLQLAPTANQGSAPLLVAYGQHTGMPVSGIAAGGALLEAFVHVDSSGGAVRIDARQANHFSCTLKGGGVALQIVNPPKGAAQRLTVELTASGADRRVRWPAVCRFSGATGPGTVSKGTRTAVTFSFHPVDRVWIETGRSTGIPA